jgi:hypothetical protein
MAGGVGNGVRHRTRNDIEGAHRQTREKMERFRREREKKVHENEGLRNLMKKNGWVRGKREMKGVSAAPRAEKRNQNRDQRSGHGRIGADGAQPGGEADSIFRSPGRDGTSWGFGGGYSSRPGR